MALQILLPEVVKNPIFKNEIIESLRSQAVILICPVKTRGAAVGAEHNVFSANLTLSQESFPGEPQLHVAPLPNHQPFPLLPAMCKLRKQEVRHILPSYS